jgi:hypothetical protein
MTKKHPTTEVASFNGKLGVGQQILSESSPAVAQSHHGLMGFGFE